jgi:hypothetical protein
MRSAVTTAACLDKEQWCTSLAEGAHMPEQEILWPQPGEVSTRAPRMTVQRTGQGEPVAFARTMAQG